METDMNNEQLVTPVGIDDADLRIRRLEDQCIRLQDRVNELHRLDQVNSSTILKLTECCKEAADVEREACAKILDDRAAYLREKANAKGITVIAIRNFDMAALILSDMAEMIRNRK